jgi:hypothetical protein
MATHAPIMGAPICAPTTSNPYLRSYRAPVLAEIDAFIAEAGMSETRFGCLAIGDPNLVGQLRDGRDPRSKTVLILQGFIASQREGR